MNQDKVLTGDALASSQRQDVDRLRKLSLRERGELIWAACQAAAEIEASRRRMGLPPSEPAPWPDSTRQFLAEAARRVRDA
jgi:hypothetical protein